MYVCLYGSRLGSATSLRSPSTHFLPWYWRRSAGATPLSFFGCCVQGPNNNSYKLVKAPERWKCASCSDFPFANDQTCVYAPPLRTTGMAFGNMGELWNAYSVGLWTHCGNTPQFIGQKAVMMKEAKGSKGCKSLKQVSTPTYMRDGLFHLKLLCYF